MNQSSKSTLYGIHSVRESIGRRPVEYVLIAQGHGGPRLEEILQLCRIHGVATRFVPRQALDRIAGGAGHQNVAAICSAKPYDDLDEVTAGSGAPLIIALDGVEDPANLGAVIRTCVAAGASGAIVPERRAAGLSPAVARSASGALEHLKIARVTNLARALSELKKKGIWVYGLAPEAAGCYLELDYSLPCVLVFGGEERGLHRLVRETCDALASIPLYGPIQSLNVSAAAAVVLYEAARQRHRRRATEPVASDKAREAGGGMPHDSD